MKRIEPILRKVAQPNLKFLFQADASNVYWGVELHKRDRYKTVFSLYYGQMCYNRMGQGLTGAAGTYARLKDIVTGHIPSPDSKLLLEEVGGVSSMYDYF